MMIESIESFDRALVLFINGAHSSLMDQIMWFFSGPFIIIPISLLILWSLYVSYNLKQVGIVLLGFALAIVLSDLSSVYLFKEMFMRYRPSHHFDLVGQMHFHKFDSGQYYQGGMYGFVSSHASNYFTVFSIAWVILSKNWVKYTLLGITLIILYSRVYLGVHYVSDIICGAILGYIIAKLVLHFLILRQIKDS
ncbi:MAG: phosphatase PAP2 family protein [Crocinitomicaceae bacterium]|nr:phosphatase PAP2 family protein [Crocinitomicaceae bacterium]